MAFIIYFTAVTVVFMAFTQHTKIDGSENNKDDFHCYSVIGLFDRYFESARETG